MALLHETGDVFSTLFIVGSDVIGRALARLAGGMLTPVTFRFDTFLVLRI